VTLKGYRHRIIVQDRSGSMDEILDGAQAGLDEFLVGEVAAPGSGSVTTVSLWDFDTEVRCVHSFVTPAEVLGYQIRPRGGTNMYDAVMTAVIAEGSKLASVPENQRPEDVTVIVDSDGKHNTTVEYTGDQVKALLDRQQEVYGWRVLYMGCNQDALKEGAKIGTRGGLSVNTVSSDTGQRRAWKMSSNYLDRVPVASSAAAMGQSTDLSPEERSLGESEEEPATEKEEN
jgi:hypothetical protein